MSQSSLPPVRPPTKTELLHQRLREGVLSNALAPGSYLNIDELARQHGVSPIPVREAVARLATERLVVMRPHIGAEVATLSEDSVHDVFALLEGLETASASRIVELASLRDIEQLEVCLEKLEKALRDKNTENWGRANAAFHLSLAEVSRLPLVLDGLRVAFDHWERIRRYFFREAPGVRQTAAQREHKEIVAAIRRGSSSALERLLRSHNRAAREAYLSRPNPKSKKS